MNDSGLVWSSGSGGSGSGLYLPLAGGNMTGNINLVGNAQDPLNPVTLQQFSGAINGLDPKQSVTAGTTGALPANTYFNGPANDGIGATLTKNTNGALPSQDSVSLINGDSLLVKDELNAVHNGIYVVTSVGSAGSPWILTRRADMETGGQANGAVVIAVLNGATLANKGFLQYNTNTTVGASNLGFTVYNNNVVVADQVTLDLTGGVLSILAGGILNTHVNASAAISGTKIAPNFGAQDVISTGSSRFKSLSINAGAGTGFINLIEQTSPAPGSPDGMIIFCPSLNKIAFRSTIGAIITFDNTNQTANRDYSFPDASGFVALTPSAGFVKSNGTILSSVASIDLSADVTGVLPLANGGTNNAAGFPANRVIFSNGTELTSAASFVYASNLLTAEAFSASGTGGAGYIAVRNQASTPSTPSTSLKIFSDSSTRFSILNPSGFVLGLNTAGLSANRVQDFADASGTIALVPSAGFVTSNGTVLSSQASITLNTSDVSGTLPMTKGGSGSILISSGLVRSNGTALSGNASVDLTSEVSNTLPISSGGTGSSAISSGFVKSNGSVLSSQSAIALATDVSGTLPFANGGTGSTSIASGIVTSNGTALSSTAFPSSGIVLSSGSALSSTTFPTAGVVTSNGSLLSSYVRQALRVTATQTNTTVTPAAITELTTTSLAPGSYAYRGVIIFQTVATTTGIGFRVNPGTATLTSVYGKFLISQAASGTVQSFQYSQLNASTNVVSASVIAANTDTIATFEGMFTVSVAGTVSMQFRSEVAASGVSVRVGSFMIVEAI